MVARTGCGAARFLQAGGGTGGPREASGERPPTFRRTSGRADSERRMDTFMIDVGIVGGEEDGARAGATAKLDEATNAIVQ